jgi:hypothetical protein
MKYANAGIRFMIRGIDKRPRCRPTHRAARPVVSAILLVGVLWPLLLSNAWSQREPAHYFHSGGLPPGAIGTGQLLRGGPLPGYFQPVEIKAPEGAAISLAVDGRFERPQKSSVLAGMLIGQVYRVRITEIPRQEGFEVFPTIEVVNRLYPPPGLKNHFPIPVHVTADELELALAGRFVTRVIYLEDPQNALPVQDRDDFQRYWEVRSDEDALKAADRLGKPVAILRMGSRVPDVDAMSGRFTFGCPPLVKLSRPAAIPDNRSGLEDPIWPAADGPKTPIPRVQLPTPARYRYRAVPRW